MAKLMAVTFEKHGNLHYLDPDGETYAVGDWVLYPTEEGLEVAQCVWGPEESTVDPTRVPKCAGRATPSDMAADAVRRARRTEIRRVAVRAVQRNGLPMKVVATDVGPVESGSDRLAIVYFTAPSRVDFRALLGELNRTLASRVDLRQVGARDVARLVGDVGPCGRELCCIAFMNTFEPVSLRLAKDQGLPNNPMQISGSCGKLLCCLAYEHPLYEGGVNRCSMESECPVAVGRLAVVQESGR